MSSAKILELPLLPRAIPSNSGMGSDCALFERFRGGDRDAFTALYRDHQPSLYRFAFHMTADPVRAADVVQDVFVWLIHHPAAFDSSRGDLSAFLVGVARNILHRYDRQSRRWLPLDPADRAAETNDPDRALDAANLRKAIAVLPVQYREAVVLCDLESKSYEEAAALAGCAVGTIRSRLHRGRELLARKLGVK